MALLGKWVRHEHIPAKNICASLFSAASPNIIVINALLAIIRDKKIVSYDYIYEYIYARGSSLPIFSPQGGGAVVYVAV